MKADTFKRDMELMGIIVTITKDNNKHVTED